MLYFTAASDWDRSCSVVVHRREWRYHHVVTSRGNLACWSTTSLLPDRPYVLVDQVELCDEGAGGGQVQEPGALVIHIQHLDSRVELYLKHPTLGQ